MGNNLKFYFKQGISSIKRSTLVILGLVLATSIIAGMNFYLDSYQNQALDERFTTISDTLVYDLEYPTSILPEQNSIYSNVNTIISLFEAEDYHLESWNKYQEINALRKSDSGIDSSILIRFSISI